MTQSHSLSWQHQVLVPGSPTLTCQQRGYRCNHDTQKFPTLGLRVLEDKAWTPLAMCRGQQIVRWPGQVSWGLQVHRGVRDGSSRAVSPNTPCSSPEHCRRSHFGPWKSTSCETGQQLLVFSLFLFCRSLWTQGNSEQTCYRYRLVVALVNSSNEGIESWCRWWQKGRREAIDRYAQRQPAIL